MMKKFLEKKEKGYFCSVAAIILTALGLVFYRMLTEVSFETTERPLLVILFAFGSLLFSLIASYKDYAKVPSIAAYALATLCFFTLLEGRASYLAFYFSGDVMNTGLSPYMIGSFVCFLLSMIAALLAVIFEEDKVGCPSLASGDWKVLVPMFCVVAILATLVSLNADRTGNEPNTAAVQSASSINANPETPDEIIEPAARYKVPTVAEEVWQEYTGARFAAESISEKPIAYQLIGHGDVDAGGPVPFDALLNLYEDGEVVVTVFGRERAYQYFGYWTNVNDENLWFCVMDYTALGQDQICTIDYGYDLTGHFDEITLNIALGLADGGQFVRTIPAGGDGKVQYPSVEEWLKSFGYEIPAEAVQEATATDAPAAAEAPEASAQSERPVLFSFQSDSENYLLDICADGTYIFTFKTANLVETGTWSWKEWKFSLTDANGKVTEAIPDQETHALKLHFVAAVNEAVNRDFEAGSDVWGPAFGGQGTYELPHTEDVTAASTPEILFSFVGSADSFLMDLYTDGTYKFTFTSMKIEEAGTWTWQNWKLTLTSANGIEAIAVPDTDTHALKLHFVADINPQLNCDFSAESGVWGPAFGGNGDYSAK